MPRAKISLAEMGFLNAQERNGKPNPLWEREDLEEIPGWDDERGNRRSTQRERRELSKLRKGDKSDRS